MVVPEANLMPRPPALSWEVAGSLYTAGTMAWTAVEGLGLGPNDTVVITAAAGGVGCLAAQFARMRGATVIGTSAEARFDFLRQFGVLPSPYGHGLADRVRALTARPVTAFLDFLGGQVEEAKALDVPSSRILTVLDWEAVDVHGVVRSSTPATSSRSDASPPSPPHAASACRSPTSSRSTRWATPTARSTSARRPGRSCSACASSDYPGQRVREPEIKEQDVTLGVPTPHDHMDVEEAVPPAIGDGSVRRRHREERAREV